MEAIKREWPSEEDDENKELRKGRKRAKSRGESGTENIERKGRVTTTKGVRERIEGKSE
jgi:hypothetical protein